MPYQKQTEEKAAYVDVRFYLKKETEEWTDEDGNVEETYTSYDIDYIERKKMKGVDDDDLYGLGESFFQMDSYQEFFATSVPSTVSGGNSFSY